VGRRPAPSNYDVVSFRRCSPAAEPQGRARPPG